VGFGSTAETMALDTALKSFALTDSNNIYSIANCKDVNREFIAFRQPI
jgi:hypothetical protein